MAAGDFGSFWQEYVLPAAPEAAYFSAEPFKGGYSPVAQQYWGGQYGDVTNAYVGYIGQEARAGRAPENTFLDFLEQYPWTERYTAMSPSMRPGGRTSRFAPATRYVF